VTGAKKMKVRCCAFADIMMIILSRSYIKFSTTLRLKIIEAGVSCFSRITKSKLKILPQYFLRVCHCTRCSDTPRGRTFCWARFL